MEARFFPRAMSAWAGRFRCMASLLLIVLAIGSMGASARSRNFVIQTADPALAKQIAQAAEKYRRDLAVSWLGKAMPDWSAPCVMSVRVDSNLGAGGETTFMFDRGEVYGWRMNIQGSSQRIFDSVLPHEITHMILASHFRQPLPRWADEGAATSTECAEERDKHFRMLKQFLSTGRGIPFSTMFALTEYPADVMPLYAQGFSLADYLIQQGGRRKFLAFVGDGLNDSRWSDAIRRHYGSSDLGKLQNQWLAWVREGHPRLQPMGTPNEMSPGTMLADATGGATDSPTRSFPAPTRSIRSRGEQLASAGRRAWPEPNLIYHIPSGAVASSGSALSTATADHPASSRRLVPVVFAKDRESAPVRSQTAHPQPIEPARQVIIEWNKPGTVAVVPMCGQQGLLR